MYRILVVDDEASICRGLELGLLSKDYQIDLAHSGHLAVEKGMQENYDILIVDLCLPDMHGLEVIKKLKKQNPQIIPILITAYPTTASGIEAKQLGVDEYLEKPFHIQTVRDAISRGITKRDFAVS